MAINKAATVHSVLSEINKTQAFSADEIAWCASILNRREPQMDGLLQLQPLIEQALRHNLNPPTEPYARYLADKRLRDTINASQNILYKQRRVLIACPQRKQHLPDGAPPPNLAGMIAPQAVRVESDQCFGLDHCESRTYFVDRAVADGSLSHILFMDEDTLLPLNALTHLLSLNLQAVGLNYCKKDALGESIATEIRPDSRDIMQNFSVPCNDPTDLEPRQVNCLGLGALLVDVDAFRKLQKPYFAFQRETLPNGQPKPGGRIMLGEDSYFCRNLLANGIRTYILPGMVAPHCDFQTGDYYGPEWLIDPKTKRIRPELQKNYTHFSVDPKKLYHPYDHTPIFGRMDPETAKRQQQRAAS